MNRNYFVKLFNRLAEKDKESGEKYIYTDCETLDSPDELKSYMLNIIKSNMQYDFNIEFDDEDVIEFAEAILPKKDMFWEVEYNYIENIEKDYTLKQMCDLGFNSVMLNGESYWRNPDGTYSCGSFGDDVPEKMLNTKVELQPAFNYIDEDMDGYTILHVKKRKGE